MITPGTLKDDTLCRLWTKIEENIDDSDLNVTKLLRVTSMSRSTLHRKLTTKAGMSATAFIRYIRLMKAHSLLIDHSEMTVSEIAFDVGFTSLSYFSRKFTQLFGASPKYYKKHINLKE